MKKVLIVFLALVSSVALWMSYSDHSQSEFRRIQNLAGSVGEPFRIPADLIYGGTMFPLLEASAQELGVNVFRTSQIGADEINHFALVTGETAFWDGLKLRSGKFLGASDHEFLSTVATGEESQVGQLAHFGNVAQVNVLPLARAYDVLLFSGRYYAELPDGVSLEQFLEVFVQRVNAFYESNVGPLVDPFTVNEFLVEDVQNFASFGLGFLPFIGLLAIVTVIAGVYFAASQGKKISILKLNGLKTMTVWWLVLGRLVVFSMLMISVSILAIALMVSFHFQRFEWFQHVIFQQTLIFFAAVLLSFGVVPMIKRISIGQGIKNKNSTRFVFILNTLIKLGLATFVIGSGLWVWEQFQTIRQQERQLASWSMSEDYGTLFPFFGSAGRGRDYEIEMETAMFEGLFPLLEEMGSLLVNTSSYEAWDLEVNGMRGGSINRFTVIDGWRQMQVNPNYLRAFPLKDIGGNVIGIDDEEERVIVLIPEHYRGYEQEIIASINETRQSRINWSEIYFDRPISDVLRDAETYVIWMPSHQQVFSFNPEVMPDRGNYLVDPIIQVMTRGNAVGVELVSMARGGGARDPWKVRLLDGDARLTYEQMLPYLQAFGLDDNFPGLVTINEAMLETISQLRMFMNFALWALAVMFVIFTALSLQNTVLFFRQYRQKFVIERVFGTSFWRTYKRYFMYLGGTWILQLPLVWAASAVLGLQMSWLVLALVPTVEVVLSVLIVQRLERKNKLAVLKGEG